MHVRTRTWFGFVVALSLLFIAGSRFGIFSPLESATLAAVEPVESALRSATRPLADFVNNLTDINRLSDENQGLKEQIERLQAENARLTEAERELRQIEQFIQIRGSERNDTFTAARVFAGEPNNLQDLIAIDRGSADGIEQDMVVLTRQGTLVGTIARVHDQTAWVRLITDQTSAVSALTEASRVQGVVAGSADGTLTMEFVEKTADVKEGDLVLTSGLGGRYPAGELIGKVVRVERTAQELFQSVRVQPLADLSRLEEVLVLTSFLPVEPGPP
jgi:rod shape-determining protein MreC